MVASPVYSVVHPPLDDPPHPIDYFLMIAYFAVVLVVGWMLRRSTQTSTALFLSGQSTPAWVAGLAFISANLAPRK